MLSLPEHPASIPWWEFTGLPLFVSYQNLYFAFVIVIILEWSGMFGLIIIRSELRSIASIVRNKCEKINQCVLHMKMTTSDHRSIQYCSVTNAYR